MFYSINSYNRHSNAVFWHWHSLPIILPLFIVCCPDVVQSQLVQKSAVQVATVVMKTMQLVLSQLKNFLTQ